MIEDLQPTRQEKSPVFDGRYRNCVFDGDEENSVILGGSVSGRIHSIPTVKELFDSIVNGAEEIIKTLPQKVIAQAKEVNV